MRERGKEMLSAEKTRKWLPSAGGCFGYKGSSPYPQTFRNRAWMQNSDGRAAHQPRVEDDVLVRGHGRYAADAPLPNQAYAYFVRSPHAFARIVSVDVSGRAERSRGVVGVLTAKDMEGVGNLGRHPPLAGRGGKGLIAAAPAGAGRRTGRCISASRWRWSSPRARLAAQDAAELVAVEYEALTPVTDARAALRAGAPQIWPQAPGNLAVDWPGPAADPDANARQVDEIFAARKIRRAHCGDNQRMVVASMEPRGATASYDAATDSYTLRVCSQGAGAMRDRHGRHHERAEGAPAGPDRRRRRRFRPEDRPLSGIRRAIGRRQKTRPPDSLDVGTLRSVSQRQPGARHLFRSGAGARRARAASWRCASATPPISALMSAPVGANIPTWNFTRCLPGMYDIRHIDVSTRCVFTNTIATAPYRGAGRPEANYVLERVVEEAARVTGIDPVKAAAAQPHPRRRHAVQDRHRHHL